ncbi:MAG: hypothetical protein QOH16_721 [Gaiellaceae bacterium]|nr:hypothetical protein [Gaiellaceae bacterium]
MARVSPTTVLNADERTRVNDLSADSFTKSFRYRTYGRAQIFATLVAAVDTMKALKYPDPYNGRVLGALASDLIRNDDRAQGVFTKRKSTAVRTPEGRDELFELVGLLVAEQFLKDRKDEVPREPLLANPRVLLDHLDELLAAMKTAGEAMQETETTRNEISTRFEGDDEVAANLARSLIEGEVIKYEKLVPETDADDEIPDAVERRSISRAALLQLAADDLVDAAAQEGLVGLTTKAEIADALATKLGDDVDAVARLVLRRTEGDPSFGLVTRLVPLNDAPSLADAAAAFRSLRGHFIEVRPAVFFIFGEVDEKENRVEISGRIRSFSVRPEQWGGNVKLSARETPEKVRIVLRRDQPWAEVNVRRTSDLGVVRSVLRRTGEIEPKVAVVPPKPLADDPFSIWDTKTLWMLDFIRRDLQAPELRLDDTIMANFVLPKAKVVPVNTGDERRPNVDAVRFLGRQLQDHPEACARIASGSHLRDLEMVIRRVTDVQRNFVRDVRVRLSWESDHLAVLSGADDDKLDSDLHREIVRLVRDAGNRELSDGLIPTLQIIQRKAREDPAGASQSGTVFPAMDVEDDAA